MIEKLKTLYVNTTRAINNWINGNKDVVRLWVDLRKPAPSGWYWATSVEEALDVLANCVVERMDCSPTFAVLMVYAIGQAQDLGYNIWPEQRPQVHDADGTLVPLVMESYVEEYGHYKGE